MYRAMKWPLGTRARRARSVEIKFLSLCRNFLCNSNMESFRFLEVTVSSPCKDQWPWPFSQVMLNLQHLLISIAKRMNTWVAWFPCLLLKTGLGPNSFSTLYLNAGCGWLRWLIYWDTELQAWLHTLTVETEYQVWMFSFKQPYHEHQWIKSKSVNTNVVCDILHATMEVWRKK